MTLEYESRTLSEPPSPILLKISFWCGLIPLVVGFAILLAYRLFQWEILPAFGLLWLALGAIIAGIGAICLLAYFVQFVRGIAHDRGNITKIILVALLLVSNLPAAWFCMDVGMRLMPRTS